MTKKREENGRDVDERNTRIKFQSSPALISVQLMQKTLYASEILKESNQGRKNRPKSSPNTVREWVFLPGLCSLM